MKMCHSCEIKVGEPFECCPLCQNELEIIENDNNENKYSYFPGIGHMKARNLFYKILLFIILSAAVICCALEYVFNVGKGSHWSTVVILWILAFGFLIGPLLKKKPVVGSFVTNISLFITADMAVTCYYFGDMKVCTHYQIPILILITVTINFILGLVDRRGNAMVYTLCNVLVGVIPDVVMHIRNGSAPILWDVCLLVCIITFIALVVFKGTKVTSEISKRLNL